MQGAEHQNINRVRNKSKKKHRTGTIEHKNHDNSSNETLPP